MVPRKGHRAEAYNHVYSFLLELRVTPLTNNQHIGISWLELIFLYFLRGGARSFLDIQMKEPPPPIFIKRLFKTFQSIVRDVVRYLVIDADKALFKSPISSERRLGPMGFMQSTPKLKFLAVISTAERRSLGILLLQLRPSFTRAMERLFITGELKIEPCHFVLKRALAPLVPLCALSPPPWLPCAPSPPSGPLLPLVANFKRASIFLHDFAISCPHCNRNRVFQGLPLRKKCWTQIWCTHCHESMPAHRWHCPCGVSWRACPAHSRWPDYATLHAQRSLKHRRLARRTNHDAAESSNILQQVYNARNRQTFNLEANSNITNDISSSSTCLINCPDGSMLRSPKRKPASLSMGHILRKCPKLHSRFSYLAAGH